MTDEDILVLDTKPVPVVGYKRSKRHSEFEGSDQLCAGVMTSRNISNPESFKVRKGAIGGYKSELSSESTAFVNSVVKAQLNPIYEYRSSHL